MCLGEASQRDTSMLFSAQPPQHNLSGAHFLQRISHSVTEYSIGCVALGKLFDVSELHPSS